MPRAHNTSRLAGFDYAQPGAYFVTLVTAGREMVFDDARFKRIAEDCWQWLSERFSDLVTDEFVVMPNHLHGVLILTASNGQSR